jgi:hypothetical protein
MLFNIASLELRFEAFAREIGRRSLTMKKRLTAYLVGLSAGALVALGVNYAIHKPLSAAWIWNCGNFCGFVAVWWAEHRGLVPTPEDVNRPITLFPREPDGKG